MSSRSSRKGGSRPTRGAAAVFTVVLLSVFVAACGGSSGGDTSGGDSSADVAAAKKQVAIDEAPVEFEAPGPAIDVGTKLQGQTYYQIVNGLEFPFIQGMVEGIKEAAEQTGMNVVITDGEGSTAKAAALIEQAIGRDAAAIALYGFSPNGLTAPIRAAKEADIPVILTIGQDPTPVPSELAKIGVSAIASYSYSEAGRVLADYVVADSEGDAKIAIFDVPEIESAGLEKNGFLDRLAEICPGCETTTVDSPLAQWQSGLPSQTASVIQKDPSLNYLFPIFDGMVFSMSPSVARVGAQEKVKIVSNNASQPLLQEIQDGTPPMAGDVGVSTPWLGWALMDQAARLLLGEPPVEGESVPLRLFTEKNLSEIDLDANSSTWFGDADFRAGYSELWGYGGE